MHQCYRLVLHLALGLSALTFTPLALPQLLDTGCLTTIAFGETLLCTLSTPGEIASFTTCR